MYVDKVIIMTLNYHFQFQNIEMMALVYFQP